MIKQFPFSYTGELIFYKPDNFESITNDDQLNNVSEVKSLLNFYQRVKMFIQDDNTTVVIKYHISLFEQNIILLFCVLFSIFFFFFDTSLYAYLILVLGFAFYISNLMYVSRSIKERVLKHLKITDNIEEYELWKKQQVWMKDKSVCPACGESKNPYSNKCVNCGIYFSKNKQKVSNKNLTQDYSGISVNYIEKKKN